jgi:hypothetical protein
VSLPQTLNDKQKSENKGRRARLFPRLALRDVTTDVRRACLCNNQWRTCLQTHLQIRRNISLLTPFVASAKRDWHQLLQRCRRLVSTSLFTHVHLRACKGNSRRSSYCRNASCSCCNRNSTHQLTPDAPVHHVDTQT